MRSTVRAMAFLALAASSSWVHPQEQPDQLIRTVVTDVLAAYEAGRNSVASNPNFLREIVEQHVLPHVDFVLMSKLVLGKHWRKATEPQRREFADAFREHLIRTYSRPLADYQGQTIDFLAYHPGNDPERATVDTRILPHEGLPIPVSYRLRRKRDEGWKVYDISIDAVSMVSNYRSAYAKEISRKGLDAFITALTQRTARPTAAASQ